MPSEQILDTINIHKVPDLQTWKNNYQDVSGKIRPGDLVSFPPSLLGEVLPTYPTSAGVTFLKATTTNSGTTTSWDVVDSFPDDGNAGDVLTSDGNDGVEWTGTAAGSLMTVTNSITSSSTNSEIPTASAVYNAIPTVPSPSTTTPKADGTASSGNSIDYARADHIHPLISSGTNITITTNNQVNTISAKGLVSRTGIFLSSDWSTSNDYKVQTITVSGLDSSYDVTPMVDVVLSGSDADADAALIEAWALVSLVTTGSGTLTAKCVGDSPTVNIPIVINTWE